MLEPNDRRNEQKATDNDTCIGDIEGRPAIEPENTEKLDIHEVYHALGTYETVYKVSNATTEHTGEHPALRGREIIAKPVVQEDPDENKAGNRSNND